MNKQSILYKDSGETVLIGSGGLVFEIEKSNAQVLSAKWDGDIENLMYVDGRDNYFVLNYHLKGKRGQYNPKKGDLTYYGGSVTEEYADFMLLLDDPEIAPFRIEMRFSVRAGISGLYFHSVYSYTDSMPDGAQIDQDRYALYVNGDIFDAYKLGEEREGVLPAPKALKNGELVMDATYKLEDGSYYTKYSHINYEYENELYGLHGKGLGAFVIKPYSDYFNGGPTRQELTLHQTYDSPILLWHGQTSHYGRPALVPGKGWSKMFGPVLFYFNQAATMEKSWVDATQLLIEEKKQWPCKWIDTPEYQKNERGCVTGEISIENRKEIKNGIAVLGAPKPDWQLQCEDYIYHAKADSNGSFKIPHVRAGEYSLYFFADDHIGEYRRDNVEVSAGGETKLGEISWQPETQGELLWQIGKANRTAGGFYGGEDYHRWGQWFDYNKKFRDGVQFQIGSSKESVDFNYYQPYWNLSFDEQIKAKPWIIRFDLDEQYEGNAVLTLALAGVVFANLKIEINGSPIGDPLTLPPVPNDNSLYRSGNHGVYRVEKIRFDANFLFKRENELKLSIVPPDGQDMWMSKYASVLYDCIRLEVE